MNSILDFYKKYPKERIIFTILFIIIAIASLYLANRVIDFIHLCLIYDPKEVLTENLEFLNKRAILVVSNGDRLSGKQSFLNFLAVSVTWIIILCMIFCFIHKLLMKLKSEIYKRFYTKVNP